MHAEMRELGLTEVGIWGLGYEYRLGGDFVVNQ